MPALFHGYGAVDISSCTALALAMLAAALAARLRRRGPAGTADPVT
jgi:hypothetical protein